MCVDLCIKPSSPEKLATIPLVPKFSEDEMNKICPIDSPLEKQPSVGYQTLHKNCNICPSKYHIHTGNPPEIQETGMKA